MRMRHWSFHDRKMLSMFDKYTFRTDRGAAVLQRDVDAIGAVKLLALKPFYGLSCLFMCHVMGG